MHATTRVLIADDHVVFRSGVAAMAEAEGLTVVAQAPNGLEAVLLAEQHEPDVVLMDLTMPVMDGIEATRRIKAALPACEILVVSTHEDEMVLDALIAGASGSLPKRADGPAIAAAVRLAAEGGSTLAPAVAGAVVRRLRELDRRQPQTDHVELTRRELDVLQLMAQGQDNRGIAGGLHISPSTVKHHVAAILEKLGMANRTQAAVEAVRRGLA